MKYLYALGLAATATVISAGSSFGAMISPPNPNDWTQGHWELNVTKSKFCAAPGRTGAAPQKSTRAIVDMGWGMVLVTWNGANADGSVFTRRYLYRYDGQKYPAGGIDGPANEAITWKQVSATRVEFQHWSKDNKVTSEYVRTVSIDGQTMTQTAKYVSPACDDEAQVFERRP